MATDSESLYDTLGVDRDSNADKIAKAYRRLARQFHPETWPAWSADCLHLVRFGQIAYDESLWLIRFDLPHGAAVDGAIQWRKSDVQHQQ